jgi:hypothetical protein
MNKQHFPSGRYFWRIANKIYLGRKRPKDFLCSGNGFFRYHPQGSKEMQLAQATV